MDEVPMYEANVVMHYVLAYFETLDNETQEE
jgi:hypothetical protein